MIKKLTNNIFEKIFKLLIIIVSFTGLFLNLKIEPKISMILYFTILSNAFVFLFYLVAYMLFLFNKLNKNNIYYIIKGMITINIALTMTVYNIALSDGELYQLHPIAGLFVHVFTPCMVILDYIIFGEKGNLKKTYPIYWAISLFIYTLICVVYALLGGLFLDGKPYPYYFMDITKNGIFGVIGYDLILLFIYMSYSYLVLWLDNLVYKMKRGI
jgi:hypothetical protein